MISRQLGISFPLLPLHSSLSSLPLPFPFLYLFSCVSSSSITSPPLSSLFLIHPSLPFFCSTVYYSLLLLPFHPIPPLPISLLLPSPPFSHLLVAFPFLSLFPFLLIPFSFLSPATSHPIPTPPLPFPFPECHTL